MPRSLFNVRPLFFIFALVASGLSHAGNTTDDLYSLYLLSSNTAEVKLAAKAVHGNTQTSEKVADLAAEMLVNDVTGRNDLDVDTQAWLAKALGNLKRGRYLQSLEAAKAGATSRKLSGYIKKAMKQLPSSASSSYTPGSLPLQQIRDGLKAKQRDAKLLRASNAGNELQDQETLPTLLNRLGLPDTISTATGQVALRGAGGWVPSKINVQQMLLIYSDIGEVQLIRNQQSGGQWISYFTVNYQGNKNNSLQAYRQRLTTNDARAFGAEIAQLRRQQPRTPAFLDLLAERLYQSRHDKTVASGLTHVAALLGSAQNPRYIQLLAQVRDDTASRGVRRWCKTALSQIREADVPQYQAGTATL